MNIIFNGVWRMDWGFGNPNVTAALIGSLAIGVWLFAYWSPRGFWFALAAFIPLEICLLHTMSRGGLLGTVAGLGILVLYTRKPWARSRLIAVIATFWIGLVGSLLLKTGERLSMGLVHEDLSISNRLSVWKFAPQMLFDAPWGLGWGQSGTTFMAWYQPTDRHEQYLSLVNTHLSKIVELGVFGGFLYVFLWAMAVIIVLPDASRRWRAVPFGILIAFGISASFTNMAPWSLVWILPISSVLLSLFFRILECTWPPSSIWAKGGALSIAIILIMFALGAWQAAPGLKIHFANGSVKVGGGTPTFVVVPDTKVMGREYTRSLRNSLSRPENSDQTVLIANSLEKIGEIEGKILVLAGESMRNQKYPLREIAPGVRSLVLLNPRADPREVKFENQEKKRVKAFFGEFSQSPSIDAWKEFASVERLDGVGDFFPNWPELIFSSNR